NPAVTYDIPSGFFPVGATLVTAMATNAFGYTSSATFTVTVVDTTPPLLTLPADLVVEANMLGGALVTLPQATATDAADADPMVSYDLASGFFPLGPTTVNVTA